MAKVRKRTWTNSKGEQTAWIADYFDQAGKRHIKTFTRQGDAKAWLVTAQGEVARGVHTPENASITVAEAAELWIEKSKLEKLERVDAAAISQPRRPAYQAVAHREREAGSPIDTGDRGLSR